MMICNETFVLSHTTEGLFLYAKGEAGTISFYGFMNFRVKGDITNLSKGIIAMASQDYNYGFTVL